MFTDRVNHLEAEGAYVVLARALELERQGREILHLELGQPDFRTPGHVAQAGMAAIAEGLTRYTPPAGLARFRELIATDAGSRRGVTITPDMVVVGPGSKPGLFFPTLALVAPGEEVIYPDPGFPTYHAMIPVAGGRPVPVTLREENQFSFDLDVFDSKISNKTKMIVLNSPANPTGGVIPLEDLKHIAAQAQKYDAWILADEIYSRLVYDGEFASLASIPGMLERTIISDGASKTWAMTGWRIGYAVNRALAPVFTRWVTNTDSCASQISQWATVEAINGPQDAADRMRESFRQRRDLIVGLLNQVPGVTCQSPGGAFYAWPNVTEACRMVGAKDSEEFRVRLLNETGVAVLADIHFGPRVPGEGQHIRFSYAASNEAIEKGVARLADFVRRHSRAA